jgi:Peptidase inhibitor family I36
MMRALILFAVACCALAVSAAGAVAEGESESAAPAAAPVPVTVSGKVTTFSDGNKVVEIASFNECPDGWVCIWEHSNYEGRMLQFQDRGFWQNLSAYNFNDKASSWRNRINQDARLSQHADGEGALLCMQPNSSSSSMGGFNDLASAIRLYKTSDVC